MSVLGVFDGECTAPGGSTSQYFAADGCVSAEVALVMMSANKNHKKEGIREVKEKNKRK